MPRRMFYDPWLLVAAGVLAVVGLYMVGSASNYFAMEGNPSGYLIRHALHLLVGIGAMGVALSFPYQRLADGRVIVTLLLGSIAGLLLVLAMPAMGGAHRWIPLGPVNVQPSEFVKLFVVLFMAYVLSRKQEKVNDPWAVLVPCSMVVATLALLVVIEPDLGTAVMLVSIACIMIFVAGLNWRYLMAFAGMGVIGFAASVIAQPYRLERIQAFLDPSADPLNASFQLNQSLIAIGSGGLFGAGLGQGLQKAFYVPEAHTDFIFSVVGEEFGLIGCLALLAGFLVLFWRGIRAATHAPDRFGFYLALGFTHVLVLQALINVLVCLGMLPTKGLPLPFISYGGSSLVASLTAMGLLLNVSKHSN